jgi:hypothetical protein
MSNTQREYSKHGPFTGAPYADPTNLCELTFPGSQRTAGCHVAVLRDFWVFFWLREAARVPLNIFKLAAAGRRSDFNCKNGHVVAAK